MVYNRFHQSWKNKPDSSTPVTAAALEHFETGVVEAHSDIETINEALEGRLSDADLNATYAPAFADTAIAYTGDNVTSVTENGITTTYTYNGDGTVATDTRDGVTRQYTYTDGNLTGIEAV